MIRAKIIEIKPKHLKDDIYIFNFPDSNYNVRGLYIKYNKNLYIKTCQLKYDNNNISQEMDYMAIYVESYIINHKYNIHRNNYDSSKKIGFIPFHIINENSITNKRKFITNNPTVEIINSFNNKSKFSLIFKIRGYPNEVINNIRILININEHVSDIPRTISAPVILSDKI